jgi:hypothetical protein
VNLNFLTINTRDLQLLLMDEAIIMLFKVLFCTNMQNEKLKLPGIQVLPIQNGMIDTKYQVPIREKVNCIQLVTSYCLPLGISYNF